MEVAGVVLGAWPILAQGLDFYKARTGTFFEHEEMMNKFIWRLRVEHSRFQSSCETLIDGLAEDADFEGLLDRPTAKAWKTALDKGLGPKLESRLSYSFVAYSMTLLRIVENLQKLEALVGLDGRGKSSWRSLARYRKPKWREETWRKIKDCLDHDKHHRLLDEIDVDNTRLRELLPSMLGQQQNTSTRAGKADTKRSESIRQSAKSLYFALCSGWLCQCQQAHCAHLRLEEKVSRGNRHRFSIAFSYGGMPTEMSWREVEVESGEDEGEDSTLQLAPRTQRVTFQTTTPAVSPSTDQQIPCLCNALQNNRHPKTAPSCLGFITGFQRKHYVHLTNLSPPLCNYKNPISLHVLLSIKGNISSPVTPKITFQDMLRLAVVLASSLFQFQSASSPCLQPKCTSRDVRFIPAHSNVRLGNCAYISRSFPPSKSASPTSSPEAHGSSLREMAIKNEAVFALGVKLIELFIKATLESAQTETERSRSDLADLD